MDRKVSLIALILVMMLSTLEVSVYNDDNIWKPAENAGVDFYTVSIGQYFWLYRMCFSIKSTDMARLKEDEVVFHRARAGLLS